LIAFLAFVFPLALYLGFPSTLWNFDGVACAAALELGRPSYFFHANHLIYGFLGFLFWNWIGLPTGLSRALPALQLFNSLLACFGVLGLYHLLLSVLKDKWSAFLLSSALAFTAAFWVWSIEAQVYPLGFLALAWATYVLVHRQSPYKYIEVGILHGAAVLGHLMHLLWAIPALYWICEECRIIHLSLPKAVRQYLLSLGLLTAVPYLLVITFVIAPGRDLAHVLIWLKGSAGLTRDRSWAWHSAGWSGPWVWFKSTAPALWGSFWPYGNTSVTSWMWILTIISAALFLTVLIRGLTQRSERLARFSWLWLGVYGLFLSTWEPPVLCYRLPDVLPLGILLALGLRSWRSSIQIFLASLFLGSTLALNLLSLIVPMHQPERNQVYQDTLTLSRISNPDSLYISEGGLSWIYLLYFTGRKAWNARVFEPQQLAEEISLQKRRRPVYVQEGAAWHRVQ